MTHVILDLETVRNPAIPFDGDPDQFAPLPCHLIVAGCWAKVDPRAEAPTVELFTETDEAKLLTLFADRWHTFGENRGDNRLVTFGGRAFDVPLMMVRGMAHGVSFEAHYGEKWGTRYKFGGAHLDLCEELCDYGAARKYGLNHAAQLMGFPGKVAGSGADVQALWDAGRIDDIVAYCLGDVVQSVAVLAGFGCVSGLWPVEVRDAVLAECRRLIREDDRLQGLRSPEKGNDNG